MKTVISLLIVFTGLNTFGQIADDSDRQTVLENNIVDSVFVFGEWNEEEGTETQLKYLGILKSKTQRFKIVSSCWLWGYSKRATSRILVFSEDNVYLGNYYLNMKSDLPEKIESNRLVFLHSESDDCKNGAVTKLSFDDDIPKIFFLECKEGSGDMYRFEKK
jgi:hypothetical protein